MIVEAVSGLSRSPLQLFPDCSPDWAPAISPVGRLKTEATFVDESGNPLTSADAESSTAIREILPNNCFIAGTEILMADGTLKAIEQINVGDMVASEEIGTGKQSAKKVLRTFRNIAPILLTLTLGNGEKITTTPGHPFATTERGDFVFARHLPMNTQLIPGNKISNVLL